MTQPAPERRPEVSNSFSGISFHTVIQGRDITVVLPAEIHPALTGLPRRTAVFTGRDEQVEALLDELRPDRTGDAVLVSALAGMGGIGKTELVLHAADRALGRPGWFPGGVLFVDMFGYDPARRLSAGTALLGWLQAVGIPGEHIPSEEQDRSRLWRSVLDAYSSQDHRLLLIIDNAADETQVSPLLPADKRIPVLVTSRHTLDIDARLHDLDVLEPAAAVTLVRQVIALRRGSDDPRLDDQDARSATEDLVEVCAGLPLALRIVAALLADRPQLHPATLVERLSGGRARIDGLSRQQVAVSRAFDLSYQDLGDAEARLFRLLPTNPGPTIASGGVAALADLSDDEATLLLEGLHRAHLVEEPTANRWRMHDLIRDYAAGRTATTPEEAAKARRRLSAHYRDTTRAAVSCLDPTRPDDITRFTDRDQALAWLDAEHANLIGTCTAYSEDLAAVSADLALDLARFLYLRRYLDDWVTTATAARDIRQKADDRKGKAEAWNNLGLALQQSRRFEEAIAAHRQALGLFQDLGDGHGEGKVWNNLGLGLRHVRRYDEAIDAHRRAQSIFQEHGDRHTEATAWNNLGSALQLVDRFDEAIAAHARARAIFHELDDRYGEGNAWNGLGLAYAGTDRFDEAITAHTLDMEICQELGDRQAEGTAWANLGSALEEVGRFDEAIAAHTRNLEICRELCDRHGEGGAWVGLGLSMAAADLFDDAIDAYGEARAIFRLVGDRHGEGRALANLGATLEEVGRFAEARESWTEAVTTFTDLGDAKTAVVVRGWLAGLPSG